MSPTRVKICGLTTLKDANLAADLGAWALGFIFFKKSPRFIGPEKVSKITSQITRPVKKVGVFVNASLQEIKIAVYSSKVNAIQLHGDESADFCQALRVEFPKLEVIKAFQLDESVLKTLSDFKKVDFLLMDGKSDHVRGGSGKLGDWDLAVKSKACGSVILAGGLNPTNAREAIKKVGPFALDVSSGVEDAPGIKSEKKMREFFEAVRL